MIEAGRRGLVIDFTLEEVALDGRIFKAVLELVAETPNTTYVIEHLANPPATNTTAAALVEWEHALQQLAALSNVACLQLGGEVSLWVTEGRVNHTAVAAQLQVAMQTFGYGRVCFEGNWFFNNWGPPHPRLDMYAEWAVIVRAYLGQAGASLSQTRQVLRENTARIYNITLAY
jgi:predicted TIM-barrel fold metal-dependent hydrolase